MLLGTLAFLSNGTELVGDGLDPRRRRGLLDWLEALRVARLLLLVSGERVGVDSSGDVERAHAESPL